VDPNSITLRDDHYICAHRMLSMLSFTTCQY